MRASTLSLFCLITIVSFILAQGADESLPNDISNHLGTSNGSGVSEEQGGMLGEILSLLKKLLELIKPPEEVRFFLYTHLNPLEPQELRIGDVGSVTKSNFNSSLPTRFTIHGWLSSSDLEVNTLIRDAYLSKGPHNIIAVNWVTKSVNLNYADVVEYVPRVGLKVAALIDFMADNDWLKPENLTLAAHSLGAHVSGIAGRLLKSGRLHSIIGLDPAMPRFDYDTSIQRLRPSDANYVESIQTNAGTCGYYRPIGKASFYVNGGVHQPGCEWFDLFGTCSHLRSYEYFAEAVKSDGFPSIECNSFMDALRMNCGSNFSQTVRMGAPSNADHASGVFFVPVHSKPPYSYTINKD